MIRHGASRFKQELIGRPIADRIYKDVFGADIDIIRDVAVLDRELGVDAVLIVGSRLRLLGQEKFLSYAYSRFRSITVEHYQNWRTKEEGDWFNLACQFYFTGYLTENEDDFDPWVLANWPAIVFATIQGRVAWQDNKNKDGSARASFRYTIMDDLPADCIMACGPSISTRKAFEKMGLM